MRSSLKIHSFSRTSWIKCTANHDPVRWFIHVRNCLSSSESWMSWTPWTGWPPITRHTQTNNHLHSHFPPINYFENPNIRTVRQTGWQPVDYQKTAGICLPVWNLHISPMSPWLFSGYSGFPKTFMVGRVIEHSGEVYRWDCECERFLVNVPCDWLTPNTGCTLPEDSCNRVQKISDPDGWLDGWRGSWDDIHHKIQDGQTSPHWWKDNLPNGQNVSLKWQCGACPLCS